VTENAARRGPTSALRELLKSEAAGGLVLLGAAALALVLANSPLAPAYFAALHVDLAGLTVLHWINDGLMAIFFLLVGLEIKRELLDGHLATWPRRVLPGVAAAGGMLVPALIYVALNAGDPQTLRGWAIPAATDIAFALGVLALLGPRVPVSLKVFLASLAIIDDLGSVAIIAAVYTQGLSAVWLGMAAAAIALLVGFNAWGLQRLLPYLIAGVALWLFVLKSGVHATLSGVALAALVPLRPSPGRPDDAASPLHRLEHALQPWVAYAVVPLFGLANAGVSLSGMSWNVLLHPVSLGIIAGLFLGKQIGVFLVVWAMVKLKWSDWPEGASGGQVYGVSLLCGIGFTMSLFIGLLAFPDAARQDLVKVGVLAGSLLSALAGTLVLLLARRA
jgi:Na+:H+ antiporter, NhaA family